MTPCPLPLDKLELKEIDGKKYFIEEIKQNKLISKKYKKVSKDLNYIQYLLILASLVTGCVSISVFASLVGIPVGIASSTAKVKFCAIIVGIKKCKSIIQRKKKKHDKIVLLAKR